MDCVLVLLEHALEFDLKQRVVFHEILKMLLTVRQVSPQLVIILKELTIYPLKLVYLLLNQRYLLLLLSSPLLYFYWKLVNNYRLHYLFRRISSSTFLANSTYAWSISDSFSSDAATKRNSPPGSLFTHVCRYKSAPNGQFSPIFSTNRLLYPCFSSRRTSACLSKTDYQKITHWCSFLLMKFSCWFRCFDSHSLWYVSEFS